MKQLIIANTLATGYPKAPTGSTASSRYVGFYHLDDDTTFLTAAPTKDFGIMSYDGTGKQPARVFEVDFDTCTLVKSAYAAAVGFSAAITIPTPVAGKTYTLVLVKKGALPHERNTYTATETVPVGGSMTAAAMATALGNYFQAMANTGSLNISVNVSTATITITSATDFFTLKAADALSGVSITETVGKPAFGDVASIKHLASECAAGKGFTDVYEDGPTIYPGYPEAVPAGTYNVYTFRFAVGRKSAKTRDERVSQLIHIAVPVSTTSGSPDALLTTIASTFKQPAAASSSSSGTT